MLCWELKVSDASHSHWRKTGDNKQWHIISDAQWSRRSRFIQKADNGCMECAIALTTKWLHKGKNMNVNIITALFAGALSSPQRPGVLQATSVLRGPGSGRYRASSPGRPDSYWYSNAAFSLAVGKTTIVKTQYGYHVIKVTGKKKGDKR